MARLNSPKLKVIGDYTRGVDLEMSVDITFLKADIQLELDYYIQVLLYDIDAEEDLIFPLINSLHCQIDPNAITDRSRGNDDLIYNELGKSFRSKKGKSTFNVKFTLQKNPTNSGPLLKEEVLKALQDETDGNVLELKAIFVLTNELNGLLISKSNTVKVGVVNEIPT